MKKWLALIGKTENKLESRKKIKDYFSSIASLILLQSYKCTKTHTKKRERKKKSCLKK